MRKNLLLLASVILLAAFFAKVQSQQVFAHYMMGTQDADFFANEIKLAQGAGIDAFALNFGQSDWAWSAIGQMFLAATRFPNFRLFFSFDFESMPDDPSSVVAYVKQYAHHPSSLWYQGKLFVSTFGGETKTFGTGDVNTGWQTRIKDPLSQAGIQIFLCPSWSYKTDFNGIFDRFPVLDGTFNWEAWSMDNNYLNIYRDQVTMEQAHSKGKAFMAGVSPWFFTHFTFKNWFRKTEALWQYRWKQLIDFKPDFIEIITWNDYGESHYVGPIDSYMLPENHKWVDGFDHLPWLNMASYFIQAYKTGRYPAITEDKVYFWYRPHSKNAQRDDGLPKPDRWDFAEDNVVVFALLTSPAQIVVMSGDRTQVFQGQAGDNTFEMPFAQGKVRVELHRNGGQIKGADGPIWIQDGGSGYNFNAYVGQF